MTSLREKWKINLIIWHTASHVIPWLLKFQWNGKYFPGAILRSRNRLLIALRYCYCLLNEESYSHLSLNKNTSKIHTKETAWTMRNSAKAPYFLRLYDGSTNMYMNKSEMVFLIFLIMLPKYVHIGWNFQGTLKSSNSFIWNIFSCTWYI